MVRGIREEVCVVGREGGLGRSIRVVWGGGGGGGGGD